MSDLIDTTEMYLRTIYELEEEGVPPLRARIVERLHQSGPTVSQTVARMERDGLLTVRPDRRIALSAEGHREAARVMRKHRLAERLLTDVIGLDWSLAHDEACRWEHVISEAVERRLFAILDGPTVSPYGNVIPALTELGGPPSGKPGGARLAELLEASEGEPVAVRIVRIGEGVQPDVDLLSRLVGAGVVPGAELVTSLSGEALVVRRDDDDPPCTVDRALAEHLFAEKFAPQT